MNYSRQQDLNQALTQKTNFAYQLVAFGMVTTMLTNLVGGARLMLQRLAHPAWLPADAELALKAILGDWYVNRAVIEAPEGDYERLIDVAISLYTTRAVRYGWATPSEAAEQGRKLKEKAIAELKELKYL